MKLCMAPNTNPNYSRESSNVGDLFQRRQEAAYTLSLDKLLKFIENEFGQ